MTADPVDITVLPLGAIDRVVLGHVGSAVTLAFPDCAVRLAAAANLPRGTWNASRGQYDSTRLILHLEAHRPYETGKLLAICDADLSTQILTFVFGEAEVGGHFAVMSLHRLRPEVYGLPPDLSLFLHRSAKEAIHELGHTFGLKHCFRYDCVMHASDSIEVTDLKRQSFCRRCRQQLSGAREC